ncbi:MAG: MFS transporter [Acetivibrionales bacterium]|jgi:MFS family permease
MRANRSRLNNILDAYRILKGNAKVSVVCEPLWAFPFALFNFYLSLYMKELGVTDRQLGYLISLGYMFSIFSSLLSGMIIDKLGRKRTTLIFDFISWPLALFVYFISNSFALFALATFLNSFSKLVHVSWNLMVIEDADNEQRIAAFNLFNFINIVSGLIVPLAGVLVGAYGVVTAERIFLAFAIISMSTMIIVRNHFYTETKIGQSIIDESKKNPLPLNWKNIIPLKAAVMLRGNIRAITAALVYIMFYIYIPLGTVQSLYFAPFMTEFMKLGKSSVSILGGVYSGVVLFVAVFITPAIARYNNARNIMYGFAIQAVSLFILIMLPTGSLPATMLCIGIYALGFGICRPFIDAMLAEATEGNKRARIYSLVNTVACAATAVLGFVSGSIYLFDPRFIYIVSIAILTTCIILLAAHERAKPGSPDTNTSMQSYD